MDYTEETGEREICSELPRRRRSRGRCPLKGSVGGSRVSVQRAGAALRRQRAATHRSREPISLAGTAPGREIKIAISEVAGTYSRHDEPTGHELSEQNRSERT